MSSKFRIDMFTEPSKNHKIINIEILWSLYPKYQTKVIPIYKNIRTRQNIKISYRISYTLKYEKVSIILIKSKKYIRFSLKSFQ